MANQPRFGIATWSCVRRVPRKRLSLDRQRTSDPGAKAKYAAMATPAPCAKSAAFPLSVWPACRIVVYLPNATKFTASDGRVYSAQP